MSSWLTTQLDRLNAPTPPADAETRVRNLVQHMADAADILDMLFAEPQHTGRGHIKGAARAVPVDWKRRGAGA